MKHKEDLFKGRIFPLTSAIGQGKLPHKGEVIESYGNICLVKETKAYVQGQFNDYGIYRVMKDTHGDEVLQDAHIDYSNSTDSNAPHVYAAPETVVRQKFESLISKVKVREYEEGIVKDHKDKDNKVKAEIEKLKAENIQFIKEQQSKITSELSELIKDKHIKKLLADKKIRELIFDSIIIEKLKNSIRR